MHMGQNGFSWHSVLRCPVFAQLKQSSRRSGPLHSQCLCPGFQHLVQFWLGERRAIRQLIHPIFMCLSVASTSVALPEALMVAFFPPLRAVRSDVISISSNLSVILLIASSISSSVVVCSMSYTWKTDEEVLVLASKFFPAIMAFFNRFAFLRELG